MEEGTGAVVVVESGFGAYADHPGELLRFTQVEDPPGECLVIQISSTISYNAGRRSESDHEKGRWGSKSEEKRLKRRNCMITEEIRKLPARDRLILIEEIWDTLHEEADELESPGWHKDVLDARRELIEKGEAEFIALDELKAKKQ